MQSIFLLLVNFVLINVASLDYILVTVLSSISHINTYPFKDSEYLMKIHFFPLGPSFPYL